MRKADIHQLQLWHIARPLLRSELHYIQRSSQAQTHNPDPQPETTDVIQDEKKKIVLNDLMDQKIQLSSI